MIQQISSKKTFEKPLSEEKADDTQSGVLGFVTSALNGGHHYYVAVLTRSLLDKVQTLKVGGCLFYAAMRIKKH